MKVITPIQYLRSNILSIGILLRHNAQEDGCPTTAPTIHPTARSLRMDIRMEAIGGHLVDLVHTVGTTGAVDFGGLLVAFHQGLRPHRHLRLHMFTRE